MNYQGGLTLEGGLRLAAIIAKKRVAGMMPVGRKLWQVVYEGLREDKPATEPHKGVCCDAYSQFVQHLVFAPSPRLTAKVA